MIVALSGGVDSAVAALLLRRAGYAVECLHMTNWEDDGYCDAAQDHRDARAVCAELGVPLHRVNFAREYREQVFTHFLDEHRAGRTPNPDVLCNRQIKFGVLRAYARRLGATLLATGHYARLETISGRPVLLKARDRSKDQSYFLHAVHGEDFRDVLFPIGGHLKSEVRSIAREARLPVADKKDSTGICFIGERPFEEFLSGYLPRNPGPIRTPEGEVLGTHHGLAFYTLGQTKIYEATATIQFDPNPPRPLGGKVEAVVDMGSGPVWDTREYLETQYQIITSMRVSQAVVAELGLHRDVGFLN